MKKIIFIFFAFMAQIQFAHAEGGLSTIDLVEILDGKEAEAVYFYKNNWKVLREIAVDKGYIDSFQLLKLDENSDQGYHLMLVTNYESEQQYNNREEYFQEIIEENGQPKLLNEKRPNEFRRTVNNLERIQQL